MSDPATLEDISKLLDSNPSPFALAKDMPVFAQGIHDLADRLANLEHANLEAVHRLTLIESRLNDSETRTAGYAKDRDELRKRVDTVEKIPVVSTEKLDAIERRLRQIEGAVGSKNFQAPKGIVAPDPAADLKPGFFSRPPAVPEPAPVPA